MYRFFVSSQEQSVSWYRKCPTLWENLITKSYEGCLFLCNLSRGLLVGDIQELHVKFPILNFIRFAIWFPNTMWSRNILEMIPNIFGWNILARKCYLPSRCLSFRSRFSLILICFVSVCVFQSSLITSQTIVFDTLQWSQTKKKHFYLCKKALQRQFCKKMFRVGERERKASDMKIFCN